MEIKELEKTKGRKSLAKKNKTDAFAINFIKCTLIAKMKEVSY
jgi:hypothetical protein